MSSILDATQQRNETEVEKIETFDLFFNPYLPNLLIYSLKMADCCMIFAIVALIGALWLLFIVSPLDAITIAAFALFFFAIAG